MVPVPLLEDQPKSLVPNTALTVLAVLTVSGKDWMVLYSFIFDGEPYDYGFELGPVSYTEKQARDEIEGKQTLSRARQAFLRDVELPKAWMH